MAKVATFGAKEGIETKRFVLVSYVPVLLYGRVQIKETPGLKVWEAGFFSRNP